MKPTEFKAALQAAVDERHQANHPLIDKWVAGKVNRETVAGAIREHWYWISTVLPGMFFNICSKAPSDVVEMELENLQEEQDPDNPHIDLIVRFANACGISKEELDRGRGLPTTQCWANWELQTTRDQHWIAGVAGIHISSEAQEPKLFSRILPALRDTYGFSERDLEYWWLHAEADVDHGGVAFEKLAQHCSTRETQEMAIHWAREGARLKYMFWDGINLHYEVGYKLQ